MVTEVDLEMSDLYPDAVFFITLHIWSHRIRLKHRMAMKVCAFESPDVRKVSNKKTKKNVTKKTFFKKIFDA